MVYAKSLHEVIDAVSNLGAAGQLSRNAGELMIPAKMGSLQSPSLPRPERISYAKFRSAATRPARIAWIRFFRFDPVTPDTKDNGDST